MQGLLPLAGGQKKHTYNDSPQITDDDLTILTETGDVDGDGKISLSDFRKMLTFNAEATGDANAADSEET